MYLKKIHIQNIRSIADLTWQVEEEKAAGWHVILGDNGAGKTAFIRSIAFALVGPERAFALRQDWASWLRSNAKEGRVKLNLLRDERIDQLAQISTKTRSHSSSKFTPSPTMEMSLRKSEDKLYEFPSVTVGFTRGKDKVVLTWDQPQNKYQPQGKYDPYNFVWGDYTGWFSTSFGPFRRFSGENRDYKEIIQFDAKLARHLTTFDENVGLMEGLEWLRELRFKQLEKDPSGQLLDLVKNFVNQDDFLPYGVCLDNVSSNGVEFVDGNNYSVPLEELSNGYRSILSMTFELIRQLAICYGTDKVFNPEDPTRVIVPGVVLIDEVDAHLHPTWQRRIGVWFRTHFPNIQFIVTTHSPLVCQAATRGTVFKLPTPGTNEEGRMITGIELNRLLYGNILDAYSTGAFGSEVGRSEEGQRKLERLAELNFRELDGLLTEEEEHEQDQLRAMLPTTSHILAANASGAA